MVDLDQNKHWEGVGWASTGGMQGKIDKSNTLMTYDSRLISPIKRTIGRAYFMCCLWLLLAVIVRTSAKKFPRCYRYLQLVRGFLFWKYSSFFCIKRCSLFQWHAHVRHLSSRFMPFQRFHTTIVQNFLMSLFGSEGGKKRRSAWFVT